MSDSLAFLREAKRLHPGARIVLLSPPPPDVRSDPRAAARVGDVALYAAAAGLPCIVCVPVEAPEAKLAQIRAHGAAVVRVRGMLDTPDAVRALIDRLAEVCATMGMPLGTSAYEIAPDAMAGIEPLGAEIVAEGAPDRIFAPVGGGGLVVATWRGARDASATTMPPRIHAVQPAGNDTVVTAFRAGHDRARTLGPGEAGTNVSGLAVPIDLDATRALLAVRDSGGNGHLVADEAAWAWEIGGRISTLFAHDGQKRQSGEPYITHPLAVAQILAELGLGPKAIAAALLHDTVEDTEYSLDALREDFGDEVARLVDGVTKLDKVKYGESSAAETVRKMVMAMARARYWRGTQELHRNTTPGA